MTFLNPLLLLGLAAAAIPILLHLLSLRKLATVPFSSLRFIRELQKTKLRRLKLTQWLLLALRTLLIIALVMAFARPALRGALPGAVGAHARTTAVMLVDDSPSMGLRNDRGELLARARILAAEAGSLLDEGDELTILPLSAVRSALPPAPVRTAEGAAAAAGALAVSPLSPPLREGIGLAARILGESRTFNRELHIVTDLQAGQLRRTGDDSTDLFDDRVHVFLHDAGATRFQNTGITDVRIRSRILAPGRPALLEAEIRNAGPAPVRNLLLSAWLGASRVSQQTIDIPPGGTVTAPVSVVPGGRGFLEGRLELEDDLLLQDNRRYFVLNVPGDLRVLAVAPAGTSPVVDLALRARPDTGSAGPFSHQTVPPASLSTTDPGRFDVIIVAGFGDVNPDDAGRLARFVRAGGGLVLFPGGAGDAGGALFTALGLPPPGPPANDDAVSFERVDFEHPLFEGLFESPRGGGQPAVESPRVVRSIAPRTGASGQSIITLTNGVSFLTEYPAGEGRVLLVSVAAGLDWSDFPVRGLFVPFLHRAVLYLAGGGRPVPSAVVGDALRLTVRLPDRGPGDAFALRAPDGVEERLVPGFLPGSAFALVNSSPTASTGVYSLLRLRPQEPPTPLLATAVNNEPAETDLRKAGDEDLAALAASVGLQPEQITRVGPAEDIRTAVRQSRFGLELWPHFLILAILCALAEMFLGRVPRGESAPGQA